MKRYAITFLAASFSIFLVAGSLLLTRAKAEALSQPELQQSDEPLRTVQVFGVAESQMEPDIAVVRLGVQTEAETAQAALNQNNRSVQALIDQLREADIPSEDIQTQTVHLSPRYEFDNRGNNRTLVGYTAYNVVQVRTDDLESLGTLLDQSVESGANIIEGISFEVRNPESQTDQLRESAVQDARRKAEALAELAGATLGPILEIRETSTDPQPVPVGVETRTDAAAVPILPGTQSIRLQVQMTWTLIVSPDQ